MTEKSRAHQTVHLGPSNKAYVSTVDISVEDRVENFKDPDQRAQDLACAVKDA